MDGSFSGAATSKQGPQAAVQQAWGMCPLQGGWQVIPEDCEGFTYLCLAPVHNPKYTFCAS